jgi:uncharacterized protein
MTSPHLFHLAFPVDDLKRAREFYVGALGCREGRSEDGCWVDFDFFGHQIVAHRVPRTGARGQNPVDGQNVPIPHFGLVLPWDALYELAERLTRMGVRLESGPYIRFPGLPGEQATFFCLDPAGNALEFKAFRRPDEVFAKQA